MLSLDYFDKINKNYEKEIGVKVELPKKPDKSNYILQFRPHYYGPTIGTDLNKKLPKEYLDMDLNNIVQDIRKKIEKEEIKLSSKLGKILRRITRSPDYKYYHSLNHYKKLHKYCNNKRYCPNLQFVNYYDNEFVYLEDLKKFNDINDIENDIKIEDKIGLVIQHILFKLHLIFYIESDLGSEFDLIIKLDKKICIPYYINGIIINLETEYLLKYRSIYFKGSIGKKWAGGLAKYPKGMIDMFDSFYYDLFEDNNEISDFIERYVENNKTIKNFINNILSSEYVYEIECDKKFKLNLI
uniref:Uncharacterized protein n=1 Tax=Pithovirus LCDPAC02 TaxID=2506601 RepID=A0A481YQU4_9VIRU|nr:MAG: hypothetical protein LCDPAC02_03040 [Pithovirus LCDPAC02]